jgi:hypothetical protein
MLSFLDEDFRVHLENDGSSFNRLASDMLILCQSVETGCEQFEID